ncbi:MAG: HAD-IIIC family phosphatase [Parahaliea sp.]
MLSTSKLPWLLSAPDDFNEQCKALLSGTSDSDPLALCRHALTLNQANRLMRAIDGNAMLTDALGAQLTRFRLGIVSNATLDLLVPLIRASALRRGIFLEVLLSDFGQAAQEALSPNSRMNTSGLDAVLIALDHHAYPMAANSLASASPGADAASAFAFLQELRDNFHRHSSTVCLVQSLATPAISLLGGLDARMEGLLRREIAGFNRLLADSIEDSVDVLLDVASLAHSVGVENWFDERDWYLSRTPIASTMFALYADHIARTIAGIRGKSAKCLVLDLDNTLWAGVIGDDGLNGIKIGQGHPQGEAHLALQRYAKELRERGVVLAVCSKNDEQIARQAFREHPDMLLRESDIAVFVANWEDKASNIQHIARVLNIGLDALVFVDDNPMERDIVRTLLPQVAVPELPADAAYYVRAIASAGYFELPRLTADDAQRARQYAENAQRELAKESAGNIDEYLASLDMTLEIRPFDALGRQRIAQLINKTNQFNLTTRRYTEAEVQTMESNPDCITAQARLTDRFGDNGMISVVIGRVDGDSLDIDTWLMSCRVINRKVEDAISDYLVKQARERGIRQIRGHYAPTAKNRLVEDHYANLGYASSGGKGEQRDWVLAVDSYQFKSPPMSLA